METQGTPKTLKQAIENGIKQFHDPKAMPNSVEMSIEQIIELHVRDFLAQRFGVAILKATDDSLAETQIKNLWKRITL